MQEGAIGVQIEYKMWHRTSRPLLAIVASRSAPAGFRRQLRRFARQLPWPVKEFSSGLNGLVVFEIF
jgi:hypothetical protein